MRFMIVLTMFGYAAAAPTDDVRLPKFDGNRVAYRSWVLAFTAYISLKYPDLVSVLDGSRQPPAPGADAAVRDSFLRHNRQLYGAIIQCIHEWLQSTLHMTTVNP